MATTIRGNSGGREKRGTSPSSSLTKKSPKPSSSQNQSSALSSSSLSKEKILLTSDKKPVPSYLKSTVMGSKLGSTSKRSTTELVQKPSPIRRRSFDRPPPTSEIQRAIRSGLGTREVKPSRSASFSHKPGSSSLSTSSIRLASDRTYARTTSSLKDGKLDSNLSSRKKSTVSHITPLTKKGINGLKSASSTKTTTPKSVTSESSIDHDDNPMIDQLGLEDDLVSMDIEVQSLPEMSEMPDSNQELGDPVTFIDRDVEDLLENLTASEEQDLTVEGQTEVHTIDKQSHKQSEETNVIVEQQHPRVEEKHPTIEQQHPTIVELNQIVEERNMIVVEQPETVEEQNPTPEEHKFIAESDEDDKVAKNIEHGVTELAKGKKKEEETPAVKDENLNVKSQVLEPSKAQTGVWKKDKQAYNDVIEETASKLMGGKKNKVLALAGAFETVISLQDTAKK